MAGRLSLDVESSLDALGEITEAVETFGAEQDWSAELLFHVQLVLDELASNVITHGYGASGHRLQIEIESDADALRIELVDEARAYDPIAEIPEAAVNAGLAEREVGGLGFHIVKQLVDQMEYRRANGKNRLTLVKRR